jgi:phosphoglycerate dehydrogenase-like enzyme
LHRLALPKVGGFPNGSQPAHQESVDSTAAHRETRGMGNRLSVHMLYPAYEEDSLAQLHRLLEPGVVLTTGPGLPHPASFQILVAGRPERDQILASPHLRALIVPWAGIPETTRQLMLEFPEISVHNLHHNALPVAEHAIALLLAASKFIVPMDGALRRHDWTPRYEANPSILLEGKTTLVLGYGAIGARVASLCQALGMKVEAARRRPSGSAPSPSIPVRATTLRDLHNLLPRANVLIICLPLTPETTGLIAARELALLPPDAILVNIGRGPIVDEAALYQALRDGTLAAAGLDVWYNYPADQAARAHTPPSDFPFHELDNVVMSPHRAGGSTETERLRRIHLAELLNTAARGGPMPNRIDLQVGY